MLMVVLAGVLSLGNNSPSPACASHVRPSQGARLESTAFKGVELYSWKTKSGSFSYSLLWGTNRSKSEKEIKWPGCQLHDVPAVKAALSHFAKGEWVTWLGDGWGSNLAYPKRDVVDDIKAHCIDLGLSLNVGDPSGRSEPPNKELKLTKPAPLEWTRSLQLNSVLDRQGY
jgi:hypothetical protein